MTTKRKFKSDAFEAIHTSAILQSSHIPRKGYFNMFAACERFEIRKMGLIDGAQCIALARVLDNKAQGVLLR